MWLERKKMKEECVYMLLAQACVKVWFMSASFREEKHLENSILSECGQTTDNITSQIILVPPI